MRKEEKKYARQERRGGRKRKRKVYEEVRNEKPATGLETWYINETEGV